jgi:hypothetical protein
MPKRSWKQYPKNLKDELNGFSGLAGTGGLFGAIASAFAAPASIASVATGAAALVGVAAFGIAAYRAIPPAHLDPKDLTGNSVALPILASIFPKISTVGIVGISQAGKTTLRHALMHQNAPPTRTQHGKAFIMALQSTPQKYIALLDGAGEQYAQQFEIAALADIVVILLDHNDTSTDIRLKQKRIQAHVAFLTQVKHHLIHNGIAKKKAVIFLKNKSDLWCRAPAGEKKNFEDFCENESQKWLGVLADNVVKENHSNEKSCC